MVWVSGATEGTGLFMDMVDPAEIVKGATESAIPLTRASWISIFEEVAISGYSTETLAQDGSLLALSRPFMGSPYTWNASTPISSGRRRKSRARSNYESPCY